MRITTGMVQRSTLADLNRINEQVTKAQRQASSNRQIARPSDDPYNAARALQLRESLAGIQQYQRNIKDGQGWQETAEAGDVEHHRRRPARPRPARAGHLRHDRPGLARVDRQGDRPADRRRSSRAPTRPTRAATSSAAPSTDVAPYLDGATDGYQGDTDRARRARRSAPACRWTSAIAAESFLGSGRRPATASCSTRCAAWPPTCAPATTAALHGADLAQARHQPRSGAERRARSTAPARTGSTPR